MLFLLLAGWHQTASAEEEASASRPYVGELRFSGNRAIPEEELRQVIMTRGETSFLGLGLFGKQRKPFDPEGFQRDLALIRKLYAFKGYFFAQVDTSLQRRDNARRIDIGFTITENDPARIDTLSWHGLEALSDSLRRAYLNGRLLQKKQIFSVEKLIAERDRTLSFFRNHGYAFFHEDSIRIKVDTVGTEAGVAYSINLPPPMRYGQVSAVVHNPRKEYFRRPATHTSLDSVAIAVSGGQRISPVLIASAIEFRPGRLTSEEREQKTLQNLGATNIFSSIYIRQESVEDDRLGTTVHLETMPRHKIEPKILADNRYGELFLGGSLTYENRNLFGGAEQLQSTLQYGTQTSSSSHLLGNLDEGDYDPVVPYQFSFKNSLVMPVLRDPGSFYSATLDYADTRLPVLLTNKSGLVRGSYSARYGKRSRINVDFFEVEWVEKDSLQGFAKLFRTDLAENIGIDPLDDAAIDAGLDSLLDTHINQTFRVRYDYASSPTPERGKTSWKLTALGEFTGLLTWLVDEYLDTGAYEGFTDEEPQIFGTTYTQYLKLDQRLTGTRQLTDASQLAGKVEVGWMAPWGKAETTPEERRFYAGGSNSMRGWLFNTLGPGGSESEAAANFGADIKLELGLEYRLKFFKLFGQESGVACFTDLGNIWNREGPYAFSFDSLTRDFAWDWGVGLRVGSPIGPFRFDFAWRIHDPAETDPWVISDWDIGNYTFNFGIGEAF